MYVPSLVEKRAERGEQEQEERKQREREYDPTVS
jgi:hypothetical protein